ncbi:hypothetical protein F750_4708 [Streptomyces sp. PAMC 26508]|nr:hypothetical protein F750_4708 [Streptomyces sp. PAMC 26508]
MVNHGALRCVQERGVHGTRRRAHQPVRARGPPPCLTVRAVPGGEGGTHVDRRS